jgi:hypothetical protein
VACKKVLGTNKVPDYNQLSTRVAIRLFSLFGRTMFIGIGTKNTTIPSFWPQYRTTTGAFEKDHSSIGGHLDGMQKSTDRT